MMLVRRGHVGLRTCLQTAAVVGILMILCLYKTAFDHALRLHVHVDYTGNRHLVTV